jgi:hypothetical protein
MLWSFRDPKRIPISAPQNEGDIETDMTTMFRIERNESAAVSADVLEVLKRHGIKTSDNEPVLILIAPQSTVDAAENLMTSVRGLSFDRAKTIYKIARGMMLPKKWSTPVLEEITPRRRDGLDNR